MGEEQKSRKGRRFGDVDGFDGILEVFMKSEISVLVRNLPNLLFAVCRINGYFLLVKLK